MKGRFSLVALLISITGFTQTFTIKGLLRDSITRQPLELASITNLQKHKTVLTNKGGFFVIAANDQDILSFGTIGYALDTIRYTELYREHDTLVLQLAPLVNELTDVTVTTKGYTRYQLDSIQRRKNFLKDVGEHQLRKADIANSGAGIGLNLDYYSKKEKDKRKAYAFFNQNEKEQYVNYLFSPQMVNAYTGLKQDALLLFMQRYRPDYEWLRLHHSEEDLKYYINDQLKLFFNKPAQ